MLLIKKRSVIGELDIVDMVFGTEAQPQLRCPSCADGHHRGCGVEAQFTEFWSKLMEAIREINGNGEIMIDGRIWKEGMKAESAGDD